MRGAVKDSGGIIPGVEVTLTNDSTSVARSTTSNEAGEYNFPNLAPGNYTLKAMLQGYKTYQRGGLGVGTQQFLTIDVVLEVGCARRDDHGDRRGADHRDVERLDGHDARTPRRCRRCRLPAVTPS